LHGLSATLARAVQNVSQTNVSLAALGAEFTPAQAATAFQMKTEQRAAVLV